LKPSNRIIYPLIESVNIIGPESLNNQQKLNKDDLNSKNYNHQTSNSFIFEKDSINLFYNHMELTKKKEMEIIDENKKDLEPERPKIFANKDNDYANLELLKIKRNKSKQNSKNSKTIENINGIEKHEMAIQRFHMGVNVNFISLRNSN